MKKMTITVEIDLRPYIALNATRAALEAAQAEWAQAHLSDTESEDARQRVLDAQDALASAQEEADRVSPVTRYS